MKEGYSETDGFLRRMHVDPTISVGHVLTTIMIVIGLFVWGGNVDRRIEENRLMIQSQQTQYIRDRSVRDTELGRMYSKLDSMDSKIDKVLQSQVKQESNE